jgi:hypothetical protein
VVRGAGSDAVLSGEVLDQAEEFRVDEPRGHDGAGVGRLRDPQRFDAVAADAVVHAERQFVAVGLVREPVHRLKWAAIRLERTTGVVRRRAGILVG